MSHQATPLMVARELATRFRDATITAERELKGDAIAVGLKFRDGPRVLVQIRGVDLEASINEIGAKCERLIRECRR